MGNGVPHLGIRLAGLVSGWLLFPAAPATALPAWEPLGRGIPEQRLLLVAVDARDDQHLYAASAKTAYRSTDGGRSWRQVFRAPGETQITALAVDPFDGRRAVMATTGGLLRTTDEGRHWGRVSKRAGLGASSCDSPLFHPLRRHEVFAGTSSGLLRSRDGGRQWETLDLPGGGVIRGLALHPDAPDRLYVMTEQELFEVALEDRHWRSLFRLAASGETAGVEETDDALEEPEDDADPARRLSTIAVDPQRAERLFLGSTTGVHLSEDAGASWQPLTQIGLGTVPIRHLIMQAHSPAVAYAATPRGVARYRQEEQRWEVLYAGMPSSAAYHLGATTHGILAATAQGLYALDLLDERLAQGDWPSADELLANFVHEPTIEQAQQTAIAYAEVQPEKIATWRTQARLSALIPTFTVTADTNLTDFRHWDSGANPDALLRGERDLDWSANVDWELADLIWSTDQTSIDVRSKLMVQLRDDILDQVTRTYFERRRLQIELMTAPPAEPKAQVDKELRVQELTAMLDGLTGGWFSKEIEKSGGR